MTNLDNILKSRDITLPTKICIAIVMVYPVVMYGCERWTIKKGWVLKNWCLQTVVLGRTLESPLESKDIKWVNPKGNQPWISTGRTDAEAEAPTFWPPDVKCQLIRLDPDTGKDWRQEEKRMIKDELVGWHHRLKVHEFEQTPGHGEGQESLVCCSSWGCKSQTRLSDWTTKLYFGVQLITQIVIVSGGLKRDSAFSGLWLSGLWPYICMYPFSLKFPSYPGCHITLSKVPCAVQ